LRVAWRIAAAATALLACARVPPPELQADPAELLTRLEAAQARVRSVRGTARVGISAPGQSGSTDAFLVAERPDRLRIEVMDFFGNVAAVLASDGERLALHDARSAAFYRGRPTAEAVSSLLPLALPPDELVAILCGAAPVRPGAPASVEPRDGRVVLTVGAGAEAEELALGAELAVEEARLPPGGPGGAPGYALEFGLFRHHAGRRFPTEMALTAPEPRARVTLAWKGDLEVNRPSDPGLFRLDPPRGSRVVDLVPGVPAPAVEIPLRRAGE
jgi:hypothetical protein